MRKQGHWKDVYVYLVFESFLGYLVEITDVRYADIIDQDRDVETLELTGNGREEVLLVTLCKISDDELCLNFLFFPFFAQSRKSSLHFCTVPCDHADVEPQRGKFLAEAKSNAVRATGDNSPGLLTVPLRKVFSRQDSLNESPQQLSEPEDKDDASDHSQKVNKIESRLIHEFALSVVLLNQVIIAKQHKVNYFIIMAEGKSRLLGQSKVALLNYLSEQKRGGHNYNQKSIFWDREHVYNENLMLRSKVKELQDTNTRTKTRLRKSEKDIAKVTTNIRQQKGSATGDLSIFRSASSTQLTRHDAGHTTSLRFRVDSLKQEEHVKHLLLLRKRIRELKENNEKLKDQNTQLKRSIKYTRMSELQEENVQLLEEVQRVKRIIADNGQLREDMLQVFAKEKEQFRMTLRREVEARHQAVKQLRICQSEMDEMSRMVSARSYQNKWEVKAKKLQEQNNNLKMHLSTTKSQMMNSVSRDGPREASKQGKEMPKEQVRLEYSQSMVSDKGEKPDVSPENKQHNVSRNQELTSLQLLTVKNTEEYRTPVKEISAQKAQQEPLSEPVLADKSKDRENDTNFATESKQQQNPEPQLQQSPKKESRLPLQSQIEEQALSEDYQNNSEQFQDLMLEAAV